MNETSLSLLARVRESSDDDAWRRLVDLYDPLLRQWLQNHDVQASDADDLTQEVLEVVVREVADFQHNERTGAFRTWLRQILVHRLRNHWRARKYRPSVDGGTAILDRLNELEDETSQLSQIWNREHDQHVISRLMELIRPRFQAKTWEAFHRQLFAGQQAEQVAAALDMPIGSVYVARSRVLGALRREANGLVDSV